MARTTKVPMADNLGPNAPKPVIVRPPVKTIKVGKGK
jgi:hypothetical protein